jgi:RND family efflux transporter MFP subunit
VTRRLLLIACLPALAAGCRKTAGDEDAKDHAVTVRTAVAAARAFPQSVRAIGTVMPRPGHYADLGAPAPTRVARVFVVPGDRVKAGDPLIEFERAPFEAGARTAEAALTAAQATRARAARLTEAGVLPRRELDQAETDLAQAQANVVTARRSLELATLRAPLGGVVTRMSAVVGQPADPAQTIVEVVDPDALDIVFSLSASQAALVRPGAEVRVSAGQDGDGESLGTATVTGVAAEVDSAARVVQVRARMTHASRTLRVGESVAGKITTGVHAGAITVPAEALVPDGDAFKVFVVGDSDLARARSVTVGARADSLVEITRGLAAGETVVTYGAYGMQDSVKVVRKTP